MTRDFDLRSSFRCAIAPEDSAAQLKLNGKRIPCAVMNTSREGFGIRVSSNIAKRLSSKAKLELWFRGEKWQVRTSYFFQDNDQTMNVGLVRVRELTKLKSPSSWGFSLVPKFSSDTDPSFLIALMVALFLTCVCLPGIGDNLGTAPKVRNSVNSMLDFVRETIN